MASERLTGRALDGSKIKKFLKAEREKKSGLRIETVAAKCGVSLSLMQKMINGHLPQYKNPALIVTRLAHLMGCKSQDLLLEREPRHTAN